MTKYERYTSKDGATLTMSQWGGSPAELELYRKLAEIEDKIDNGSLIEMPRIIHPNRMEWYVQYQYPNGVIQYYICFSEPEAEAKWRELKE